MITFVIKNIRKIRFFEQLESFFSAGMHIYWNISLSRVCLPATATTTDKFFRKLKLNLNLNCDLVLHWSTCIRLVDHPIAETVNIRKRVDEHIVFIENSLWCIDVYVPMEFRFESFDLRMLIFEDSPKKANNIAKLHPWKSYVMNCVKPLFCAFYYVFHGFYIECFHVNCKLAHSVFAYFCWSLLLKNILCMIIFFTS